MQLEKLKNGKWRCRIRRQGVDLQKTFDSKQTARLWGDAQEKEIAVIRHGGYPKHSVREAIERYLEEVSPKFRGKTDAGVLRAFRTNLPFIDKGMTDVMPADIAAWRDSLLTHMTSGSALRMLAVLSSVYSTAIRDWNWCGESPLKKVHMPKKNRARTRRISDEEIETICHRLGYYDGQATTKRQQAAVAFLLAIETAMRGGELLSLTWDNIRGNVAHLSMTKNGDARDVPLSRKARALLACLPRNGEHLFDMSLRRLKVLFQEAKEGIPDLHFHDTRREATSRLAKKVDVLTLARITGHRDLRMLLIYYQENMASVAERL